MLLLYIELEWEEIDTSIALTCSYGHAVIRLLKLRRALVSVLCVTRVYNTITEILVALLSYQILQPCNSVLCSKVRQDMLTKWLMVLFERLS